MRVLLSLSILITLVSCSSTEEPKPVVNEIIPEQVHIDRKHFVAGTHINSRDDVHLRTSENLKAYKVNRYIDPNDPSLMHEAHIVYRVENGKSWNLQGDVPNMPPYSGTAPKWGYLPEERHNRAGLETKSLILSAEYENMKQIKSDTAKLIADFKQLTATSKYLAMQNKGLAQDLANQKQENKVLKEQLDNLVKNYQNLINISKQRKSK